MAAHIVQRQDRLRQRQADGGKRCDRGRGLDRAEERAERGRRAELHRRSSERPFPAQGRSPAREAAGAEAEKKKVGDADRRGNAGAGRHAAAGCAGRDAAGRRDAGARRHHRAHRERASRTTSSATSTTPQSFAGKHRFLAVNNDGSRIGIGQCNTTGYWDGCGGFNDTRLGAKKVGAVAVRRRLPHPLRGRRPRSACSRSNIIERRCTFQSLLSFRIRSRTIAAATTMAGSDG